MNAAGIGSCGGRASAAALVRGGVVFTSATFWAQRPSTGRHVRELGRYLDGVKIAEPVRYGQLAVYPVLVNDVPLLRGRWLTADAAIAAACCWSARSRRQRAAAAGRKPQPGPIRLSHGRRGDRRGHADPHRPPRRGAGPGPEDRPDVFCVEARRWSGNTSFPPAARPCSPSRSRGTSRRCRPAEDLVGGRPQ